MKNPNAALLSSALCLCLLAPMTDVHAQSDAETNQMVATIAYQCTNYYKELKPRNEQVKICANDYETEGNYETAGAASMVWSMILSANLNKLGISEEGWEQVMSDVGKDKMWRTYPAQEVEEMCEFTAKTMGLGSC